MDTRLIFRLAFFAAAVAFTLYLSACSALTGLATTAVTNSTQKPLVGVDTEVVAGDKTGAMMGPRASFEEIDLKDNASVQSHTTGKQTTIEGSVDRVEIEEGIPFWQAGLGLLIGIGVGVFLPQVQVRRKY